jgi:glycosyltransferase involved in cell wall biosynthesis
MYRDKHERGCREKTVRKASLFVFSYFVALCVEARSWDYLRDAGDRAASPIFASAKPIKVIANGIPLENFAPRPISQERDPVLVMMATGQYRWHGLDKLVILARKFPKWTIHILGDALVSSELAGCGNVRVHGLLKRSEFEPILARAHVGLGPMALHRKEMEEACPLKVREYLSYGLPVIGGYVDSDFPKGAEFFLQIPNREDNVERSLDAIEKFVAHWMHRRVAPSEIAHLDFRSKERERLAFLEQISNRKQVGSAVACA